MASVREEKNKTTSTTAPLVERIIHEPAIKETITPEITTIIQPIIRREIETTEIHKIVQPIYEKAVPSQEVVSSQGVRQTVPVSNVQSTQQQGKRKSGISNRLSFFGKRKTESNPDFSNTQEANINQIGGGDITVHSFRWTHRDKHLTTGNSYNGLKRTQTTSSINQSTEMGEVPANNIPIPSKKRNPFLSLFGRKNRDSGGNLRTTPLVSD